MLVLFDKDGESYDAYYYLSSRRSLRYFGGVGKDPLWTVEALVDGNAAWARAWRLGERRWGVGEVSCRRRRPSAARRR